MINKVRLKNWRSHENSELFFGTGTNALLGIIGSGKSSVLDAVCFCLFGTFPNLQGRKLKIDDIFMNKPIEKTNAEVEVHFTESGNNYSVKRVLEKGRGTTYSEVRENGKILESPNTSRVNELVERLLKVNYDLFSKAIYSEQNSMDYFLTIPRGQRMKKIDELLMIDKFEKARTNTVSLINKILANRAVKQEIVDRSNVKEGEMMIQELNNSVNQMKSESSDLQNKVNQIHADKMLIQKEIGETRKLKEDLEFYKRDEKGVVSLIEDIYSSLRDMEAALKDEDQEKVEKSLREVDRYLSETERMFKDEREKYMKLQSNFDKTKTEAEITKRDKLDKLEEELKKKLEIKKDLEKKKMTPETLESKMDEKRNKVEKFDAEMEVMRIKISDLKEVIEQLNEVESKCPLCNSKMTEEKKSLLINKKKFEINKLEEKFVKAGEKKEISKKDLEELEGKLKDLEDMIQYIKDIDKIQSDLNSNKNIYAVLKEQTDSFQRELEDTKNEVESMEKKLEEARGKKESLDGIKSKLSDYNAKKMKIQSLLLKRKQVESSIAKLEESLVGKDNAELESKWEQIVDDEKTIAARINSIAQICVEKEARVREIESGLESARKELEEVKKLEKLIEGLRIFEQSLEATQLQLRKEFVTTVNYTMNELWPNVYPYRDFTSVRLSIENGDYVLQLQEKPGKWINVEGFASGGERSIAALTLRMAFALVLAPQLKWLVLDEPTANMDVKAVEDLATTLSEHIGDFIEQTFLITHDEKLEKAVTGYAYKLERDKASHASTKVVQL